MKASRFQLPGLTALSLLGFAPNALAGGREPGSLLIFPEFDNRVGDVTMLTITNTNTDFAHDPSTNLPRGTVKVHMIYIGVRDTLGNQLPCLEVDREVLLTPGDTFTFLTRSHNPQQQQGFMYAYAKHPTENYPLNFNYLIGNALFISGIDAIDYSTNPISLEARTGGDTDVDSDGNRDLNGGEYEALPDEVKIPRFLASGGVLRSELILLGLSGGAAFETVADFLIYNDNEEVLSAQRQFRCWERVPLDVISSIFLQSFLVTTNHAANEPLGAPGRESGWMVVDGGVAYSTVEQIPNPAVYAVLVERVSRGAGAADLPFECSSTDTGSLWPNGVAGDGSINDQR
jgi:hypothetical protein